ncbi:MAG: hypothetical protein ACOX8S_10695 [Christensenellales bacterium]|jgi:Na+-transporting methylmalonyl-CoA/oxaloacetate decarboxylase gamma subunit
MNSINAMALVAGGNNVTLYIILGIILILCLIAFTKKKEPAAVEAPETEALDTAAVTPVFQSAQEDDDEIAAVIAAVMALVTAQAGGQVSYEEFIEGFHVRRIRRVPSVSQWGKAGREELLSSKNFN